jgi:two-component system, chemotaxis family, sensor kinase CheA
MDQMDDEIMTLFVEGTRERLGDIETALMDMERGGADIDGELVNKVFRAAHTIKGEAGFLGLGNIRELAHKLESLLHLIRNREVVLDSRLHNRLLAGFDRLRALVETAAASDGEDISPLLDELAGLKDEHLSNEQRVQAASVLPIVGPGGGVLFREDELSLRQAVAGSKNLYLVEYDLIHDVQARGKTPLDVISTMEASGLIVDCRMELAAVGDLDAPAVNRIPFYVLFASIVEPDIVGYLFALDSRHIHPVDLDSLGQPPQVEASPDSEAVFGPWRLACSGGRAILRLAAGGPADAALARQALLAGLDHGAAVEMVWDEPVEPDLRLLQVLASAARTFAGRGLTLTHRDGPPQALSQAAARAGFTPRALDEAGVPASVFFAS